VAAALALLGAAPADARWGPYENCSKATHCYAQSERTTRVYDSIAAEDNETAIVYDWGNGGFYTNEQWVSFENQGAQYANTWIENGQIIGAYNDCCTAFPFYAEETPAHQFHIYITPGPVASGSGQYNYDLIADPEHNGAYHLYWSSATNTAGWFEVARYGGGWPAWITEQTAGLEVSSDDNPYHAGRQYVAASDGGEWSPWSGANWYHDPGICIGHNRENPAPGNIEWTPGHNECR
jgi:hypothetical protein